MEKENEKVIIDVEAVDAEENKVTAEEALAIAENNMEVLDTQIGKVKFNKGFFITCASIGGVSAGVGAVQLVLSAPIVPVVAAIGFGLAALGYGAKMAKNSHDKKIDLEEEYNKNVDYARNVLAKRK